MDRFDIALLEALQADSRRSMADLGERIGLSASACHRRIKALEEAGLIAGYAARLDPKALGLDLQAFVEISLTSQSRETMDRFETAVADFPEILECHLMAGQADYLLRVAAADLILLKHHPFPRCLQDRLELFQPGHRLRCRQSFARRRRLLRWFPHRYL